MKDAHDNPSHERSKPPQARREYHRPEIVEFGDVQQITKGNGGSATDLNHTPNFG